jgi:Prephenate dehydrogenase
MTELNKVVIVGLGLIGGSLASALKQSGACQKVIGVARREETCEQAMAMGIVDEAVTGVEQIAGQLGRNDIIFIAVPTLTVAKILNELKACVGPEVIITDGASVKGSVLTDVQNIYGKYPANFVLGHPIAGSEQSGVEASNPNLYHNHRVILTPVPENNADAVKAVRFMWELVGAEVLEMGVQDHDIVLAATSHLPHVIAFSLVDTLAHDSQNENIFRYAAGGFKDFTRIASSDAIMWRDIMLANKKSVLDAIDLFSSNLGRLRAAIEEENATEITGVFTRAKFARDRFTKMLEHSAYLKTMQNSEEKILFTQWLPVEP